MAMFSPFDTVTPVAGIVTLSAEEVAGLAFLLNNGVTAGTLDELGLTSLCNSISVFDGEFCHKRFRSMGAIEERDRPE